MRNVLELLVPLGNSSHDWPQILTILIACLSGVTLGILFNWSSPSIPILTSNASHIQPMSLEEASYFTVLPSAAAIVSGPIFANVVDIFGRKSLVAFIAVPQIISFVLIALGKTTVVFYISRIVTGVGDATFFNVMPMYIGEVTTPKVRGLWGNLLAISIYFGGFLINVIGSYCSVPTTAYICICLPVLQLVLTWFLPESPYFLLMKGKMEQARDSLKKLRWKQNVDEELESLTKDVQRQISESGSFKDLFTIPTNRKALMVNIGIRMGQQFSGLAAFTMYCQYLFNQAGSELSASSSAIIFTGILTVANFSFVFLVDKYGRRPLLILSSFGCGIVMVLETIYFYIYEETSIDISALTWFPLGGLIIYIITCATGLGTLPTLMLGELFSASIKGKALYITNICFSLCVLSASKLFQSLSYNFGMFVPFCFFSICCFISVVFCYYCVPETKGKTLEEIQQSLRGCKTEPGTTRNKNALDK